GMVCVVGRMRDLILQLSKSSIYSTKPVYPNQGNGTSQPLHFQATLKQDGNIAIEPGEFKATSTFQVTYP
ncbi:hypothetical protein PNF16_12780, partial [Escherichia coli]|nr:hypothetical protein [Escherichia coli]